MNIEVTDDYHERSRILTYKSYGSNVAILLGSTLPAWLLVLWGASRTGHALMGLTMAIPLLIIGVFAVRLLRGVRATRPPSAQSGNLWDQAVMAWRNKPFRTLVLIHIVFMIGIATANSSNAYFTRYILHRTDAWLGLFYIFMSAGLVVGTPLWMRVSRKLDKKRTYALALLLYGLCVATWYISGPQEPIWLLASRACFSGATVSGVVLMASSMLTDAVRYDYIQSGYRREGAFTGFISLIDKLSSAVGLATMGVMLSNMGYTSSAHGGSTQSTTAAFGIQMSFAVIPAVTALLSIILLRFYTLKESDLIEKAIPDTPLIP